jgi:hypothetical protein
MIKDNLRLVLPSKKTMASAVPQWLGKCAVVAAAGLFYSPSEAAELFHRAENQVPLAIVQVTRTSTSTEVRIQTQAALKKVCWTLTGPESPYLLAIGRQFHYLDGDNTACPARRDYADGEAMVLRFAPLGVQVSTFSFVAGQAHASRTISPASAAGRDWNFIRVPVN